MAINRTSFDHETSSILSQAPPTTILQGLSEQLVNHSYKTTRAHCTINKKHFATFGNSESNDSVFKKSLVIKILFNDLMLRLVGLRIEINNAIIQSETIDKNPTSAYSPNLPIDDLKSRVAKLISEGDTNIKDSEIILVQLAKIRKSLR